MQGGCPTTTAADVAKLRRDEFSKPTCGGYHSNMFCQRAKKPSAMLKFVLMMLRQRSVSSGVALTAARAKTWPADTGGIRHTLK